MEAVLDTDGLLSFRRVSDRRLLLSEKIVRRFRPVVTIPPKPGFLSLDLVWTAFDGERIYGLGQHKTGKLDNKGVKGLVFNPDNTEILIPVAHSSRGYAFLSNLPSFGGVEYNDSGSFWWAEAVLQADMWVATTADSPPHAISPWAQLQRSYVDVTGHSLVYPEWVSGFWQCKNRYRDQSQVMEVAQGYLSRRHPLSLMVVDYFNWFPLPLGDAALPQQCWPDPGSLVKELRDVGVELMISPYLNFVSESSGRYGSALAQGLLAQNAAGLPARVAFANARSAHGPYAEGDGYVYDLFQPEARRYVFEAVHQGYTEPYGIQHWWIDCDEPCGSDVHPHLVYNGGAWPAAFVGAAYPHMVKQMLWEGMAARGMDPRESVVLARSAWAGSQRFGGAVWSGDTRSDFRSLNEQFRAGLNMAMSGFPYWTTDIGGYEDGNVDSATFRQLIVRWFQWGAFCPLFRNHGRRIGGLPPRSREEEDGDELCGRTGAPNEIWRFGGEAEAAISKVMRQRETLRPYIMAQYEEAARSGVPVMRPLFFDFWEDEGAAAVEDQLMFGPDYLVAPQLAEDAEHRLVYLPRLPPGQVWQNVFTNVAIETSAGGVQITEETPLSGPGLGRFPLYLRRTLLDA